jgi:hypothetical protein
MQCDLTPRVHERRAGEVAHGGEYRHRSARDKIPCGLLSSRHRSCKRGPA